MEAVKKLSEFAEITYLCEKPKRKILSEADSASLVLFSPILVVLSRGMIFPIIVISFSLLISTLIGEKVSKFLRSTLLFIPLFSLAVVLPRAVLDPSFGFYGAGIFSLRVWAALSFPSLLTRSYGVPYIASGLHKLGIPREFAYLLMITSLDAIATARLIYNSTLMLISRGMPSFRMRDLGYFIGYQLVRGYERGERVNAAFISRGGEDYIMRETKFTWKGYVMIIAMLLTFLITSGITI
ncbi:MAG: hypothetical protein ACP5J1_00835 [Fervidicoccaceae archaeon]